MTLFKPRETLTEQVARHVENLIAFGQLRSGERIYESTMAKQMDVSHGSIREGLLLLEKRHLVQNVPRKGAFVTPLDEHFVRSLYEVLQLYLPYTNLLDHWFEVSYMTHYLHHQKLHYHLHLLVCRRLDRVVLDNRL